jgi:hypothetical protein
LAGHRLSDAVYLRLHHRVAVNGAEGFN